MGPFGGPPRPPRPPRPHRPWGWGRPYDDYGGCFPYGCGCCLPIIGVIGLALLGALLAAFLL